MKNEFYKYDPEVKELPYKYDMPPEVPKTYPELSRDYGDFILKDLRRYNKIERNLEDLYQGVWLRLMDADLLEKFKDGLARRLPVEMSTMDACRFLGLKSVRVWKHCVMNHPAAKTVSPLRGRRKDLEAVWETSFVCECDYNQWVKTGETLRKRPKMTSHGFKSYLRRSIHNAFANLCRTQDRRCKENTLPSGTVLSRQTDGSYRRIVVTEDYTSWEASVASAMTEEEGFIDLMAVINAAKIDLRGVEGAKVLDHLVQQGKKEGGPARNVELLTFIGQGHSLAEANQLLREKEKAARAAAELQI